MPAHLAHVMPFDSQASSPRSKREEPHGAETATIMTLAGMLLAAPVASAFTEEAAVATGVRARSRAQAP
jgi:hypothetical protein